MAGVEVSWEVSGVSYVDISDEELQKAIDGGIDPDDAQGVIEFLDKGYGGDIMSDAVSDFSERDAPVLSSAEWED